MIKLTITPRDEAELAQMLELIAGKGYEWHVARLKWNVISGIGTIASDIPNCAKREMVDVVRSDQRIESVPRDELDAYLDDLPDNIYILEFKYPRSDDGQSQIDTHEENNQS